MATANFRNIYQTAQGSACKEDKGVQLKIQKETGVLWHVAIQGGQGQCTEQILEPHTSYFSRVNWVGEKVTSLTWLVISHPGFFCILHMAILFFCLWLFLHCEHKHLFDVSDIKYTVCFPSGQRKRDSCFWKFHWHRRQKAVWTSDTKDGGERGRDRNHQRWLRSSPLRNALRGWPLSCVYMEQCVRGTAVNCLQARKEIDTAAKGWPAFVHGLWFCASWEEALLEAVPPLSDWLLVYISYSASALL